jgi:abhydrolase domain-containing protein 5
LEAELRLLKHSGLELERFKIHNVPIDDCGNFVRTFEIGDRTKPKLVLIHGYGASSVAFWKIVETLSENYHLIMIDIIGMGASSRPVFEFDDNNMADEFFVEWFEKWRI